MTVITNHIYILVINTKALIISKLSVFKLCDSFLARDHKVVKILLLVLSDFTAGAFLEMVVQLIVVYQRKV